MSELQDIFDQIVIIQNAITAPSGEKDIAQATDEIPAMAPMTFPSFVNIEESTDFVRPPSARMETHTINMHFLLAPADQKYSIRTRRKWVEVIQDAFEAKISLNGTCTQAMIMHIDYGPPEPWEGAYVGATFRLSVEAKQTIAYAA